MSEVTDEDKNQVSKEETGVDLSTCLIEWFDQSIFWLLNVFKVKLRINDLVPDKGNPSTGNENQEEGVDDHVEDPEDNMRSNKVDFHLWISEQVDITLCYRRLILV